MRLDNPAVTRKKPNPDRARMTNTGGSLRLTNGSSSVIARISGEEFGKRHDYGWIAQVTLKVKGKLSDDCHAQIDQPSHIQLYSWSNLAESRVSNIPRTWRPKMWAVGLWRKGIREVWSELRVRCLSVTGSAIPRLTRHHRMQLSKLSQSLKSAPTNKRSFLFQSPQARVSQKSKICSWNEHMQTIRGIVRARAT